ncbi:MAG: SpoIID/LytB domain-containing protein [Actinobacteria bacterium]|nr:SpoIID/LytB domain-containing protein [Actinomycetota bacterium]
MRRTLLLVSVLLLVAGSAAHARSTAQPVPQGTATFVVTGHGWGHGVGLSQYGAYGYAQKGFDYEKIVLHYFPGTELGDAPVSRVRVLLTSGVSALTVNSTVDFKVKDGSGVVHTLAAGAYPLTTGLKLAVDGQVKARALPGPLLFQPGSAALALKHRYRGSIQVDLNGGKLRAINMVGLEQYLYGVVPSEMPYTWHPEALKAQAIVARSYALATRRTGAFDLYPDTRSQVYLGIEHEKASTNAAVNATAGKVVLYDGEVAKTFFFSTSGGRTASAEDVWGEPVPYLLSVPDPYDSISPHHDWGPFVFTGAKLAKMMKMKGRVVDLQAELNSSGRIKVLNVIGTKSTVAVAGTVLRQRMGLRSTWFSVGVLSLAAPTQTVVYGGRAKLIGVARGLTQAVLQQLQAGTWTDVSTVKADKDGAVSVLVKPAVSTQYRLASGKVLAASVRVPVAPLTRLYPVRTQTQLSGYVRPTSLAGTTILIQKQQGAAWPTIAQSTVGADGDFLATLQLTTGVYRARVNSGHGFVVGFSPVVQVIAP